MAVKQNNTDGNGTPGASGTVSNTSQSASSTSQKNMNPNSSSGSGASTGCSSVSSSASGSGKATNQTPELSKILEVIELVNRKQRKGELRSEDVSRIYGEVIRALAKVPNPKEDFQRFKDDIIKVGEFLAKASEEHQMRIHHYLQIVYKLITGEEQPSCAIAIVFQLFTEDMVIEAVQALLSSNLQDCTIKKTVKLLCEWKLLNFCQNLNLWILAIWSGLKDQGKLDLLNEIALEIIERLFKTLMVPVLRPEMVHIVFPILEPTKHKPDVFHKVVPWIPMVVKQLKKQAAKEEYSDDTSKCLQTLVDLTTALMATFPGYDDLYKPVTNSAIMQQSDLGGTLLTLLKLEKLLIKQSDLVISTVTEEMEKIRDGFSLQIGKSKQLWPPQVDNINRILADINKCARDIAVVSLEVEALAEFSPSYDYLNPRRSNNRLFESHRSVMSSNAKVGLVNLGNTCYMNSVLQALAMTKEFSRGILLSGSKSPLLIKIQELMALMLHSTRFELTPSRVLDATRPPGFTPGLQQDSSEFLGYLLDTLHEQELAYRATIVAKYDSSQSIEIDQDEEDGARSTELQRQQDSSSISSSLAAAAAAEASTSSQKRPATTTIETTFMGKLATTYKCLTCSWQSTNIDSFRDLQLSFPEVKNDCASNYTVQDLIDYYCSSEKLHGENQYFCERCKKLSDAERFINVISAPKNLILTLKHFKYDQSNHMRAKLMHKVFHNENVSVKVCSAETLAEIASVHYDLYAGVVHSGCSMDSGHYYTYASDGNNKWYKFNDDVVTQCKIAELNNLTPPNTPYILFYQMGGHESPTTPSTMIKIDTPPSPKLEELSPELREYINRDNCMFSKELKSRRMKMASSQTSTLFINRPHNRGGGPDDEDEQPPPASGCGDNALNFNVNRFVF